MKLLYQKIVHQTFSASRIFAQDVYFHVGNFHPGEGNFRLGNFNPGRAKFPPGKLLPVKFSPWKRSPWLKEFLLWTLSQREILPVEIFALGTFARVEGIFALGTSAPLI